MMTPDLPQRPPDFIDPKDISEMSVEEFDRHIDRIRVERLKAVRIYKQKLADKKLVEDEKARVLLEKAHEMLGKDIAAVDKALTRMCARFVKVQVLRLQLGIDIFDKETEDA